MLTSPGLRFNLLASILIFLLLSLQSLSNQGLSQLAPRRFFGPLFFIEYSSMLAHFKRTEVSSDIPFSGERLGSFRVVSKIFLACSLPRASRKEALTVSFHLHRGGNFVMLIGSSDSGVLVKFQFIFQGTVI